MKTWKKNILMRAEHHNWSLRSMYQWGSDCFELSGDGDLHIIVRYAEPVVDCVVKVSEGDMQRILSLIPDRAIDEEIMACDGEAWAFTAYDNAGRVIFHRKLGYIYHIDALEEIGRILCSYIPPYDEPEYGALE